MRQNRPMRALLALLSALAATALGTAAAAQCRTGCASCCATPPPCCVPATHTVKVPGVTVIPPTITIAPGRITSGVGGDVGGGFGGSIDVSVQASADASAYAAAAASASSFSYASGLATANAQAQNLLAASGGGGGSFFTEGGTTGNIPNLIVGGSTETKERQVCVERRAVAKAMAIQAVCLDDKAVPHPASQAGPGRDVAQSFAGELFRCLAGSHMQYVVADWAGQAQFDHGQTVVCQKSESLWRDAGGRLQCRPQTPARDCNERSLLRRYGAGIKVVQAMAAEQCVRWSTETYQAEATSAGQSFALDGGVG